MLYENKVYTYSFYICIVNYRIKKKGRSTTWKETFHKELKMFLDIAEKKPNAKKTHISVRNTFCWES